MHDTIGAVLVLAGLLLPGMGWAFGARWPIPVFAAGVISALAIFVGVVGFSVMGIEVHVLSMSLWLGLVALSGQVFRWRQPRGEPHIPSPSDQDWWLALPMVPGTAVAVWRAILQPLSGPDVDFRWNYLAELVVQSGGLDFYPPYRAIDFQQYFWADGIAPLVSSQYAWTYLAAGSMDRHWTMLPVFLQLAGVIVLLRAVGAGWSNPAGGWMACALAGATFLLQFAFNIGQETGFVTLGAVGMVYYLVQWEQEERGTLLVAAACCAALVGCAREYGMGFTLAGAAWVGVIRRQPGRALVFALMALALPGLWYLRNLSRTGNPLYPLDLGGLFPVNAVFAEWLDGHVRTYGVALRHWGGWIEIVRLLGISALPALLGLLAGVVGFRGRPGWLGTLVVAALAAYCWLTSVPYTGGGLFYAMRVLGPLLVLGCAWGGAWLVARIEQRRGRILLIAGLSLWGMDAALRAWTLPANPYRIALHEWPRAGYDLQRDFAENEKPFLAAVAALPTGKVLSDSAGAQGIFRKAGRELVPLWSPEVAFLFDSNPGENAVERLRALGYSHLLLKRSSISFDFLIRTGAAGRLKGNLKTVRTNDTYLLFALEPSQDAK
ncbi:MAG: hypothetical protein HYV95_04395 [Opitutae bacterium]|nr:hypothetical protein [Opitutae bacterium]